MGGIIGVSSFSLLLPGPAAWPRRQFQVPASRQRFHPALRSKGPTRRHGAAHRCQFLLGQRRGHPLPPTALPRRLGLVQPFPSRRFWSARRETPGSRRRRCRPRRGCCRDCGLDRPGHRRPGGGAVPWRQPRLRPARGQWKKELTRMALPVAAIILAATGRCLSRRGASTSATTCWSGMIPASMGSCVRTKIVSTPREVAAHLVDLRQLVFGRG